MITGSVNGGMMLPGDRRCQSNW